MELTEYIDKGLVHSLHTSERKSFRSCRRRWDWTSRQMYYPRTTPAPLEFGVAFHAAMEKFYDPQTWHWDINIRQGLALVRFKQVCDEQLKKYKTLNGEPDQKIYEEYAERVKLGLNMIKHYTENVSRYTDVEFTPIAVEIPFEIAILGPDKEPLWCKCDICWRREQKSMKFPLVLSREEWRGLPVTYGGRLDMLARDNTGRHWIYDWKTTSRILDEDAESSFLLLDDQISCVPLDTEILTRDGWRRYHELVVGEEVMGYDMERKALTWTELEAVSTYKNANVVKYSNKSFEFISTENHKWVTGTSNNIDDELKPFESKVHYYLKLAAEFESTDPSDITEDEAACIAWILTEGHLQEHHRSWQCVISQKKYAIEVQELLDRLSESYSSVYFQESTGCNVWRIRAPFVKTLWQKAGLDLELNGWEKFIASLSNKARNAFCTASYLAEGATGRNVFHQNPGRKQDIFRLAYFLNGAFPTKGNGKSFSLGTPNKWTHGIKTTPISEKTDVWCPQTGTGTWVMRQNGQIAITGNSYVWALRSLGVDVQGFVYVEIKKAYPSNPKELTRLYKGRRFSTDKNTLTTAEMYREFVMEHDEQAYLEGLYDEHLAWLKREGPRFHQRHQIHKNDAEVDAVGHNIWLEAQDIVNNPRVYPQPGRFSCNTCLFKQPCIGKNMNEDYQYTLDSMFEKRTRHYYEENEEKPSTE